MSKINYRIDEKLQKELGEVCREEKFWRDFSGVMTIVGTDICTGNVKIKEIALKCEIKERSTYKDTKWPRRIDGNICEKDENPLIDGKTNIDIPVPEVFEIKKICRALAYNIAIIYGFDV